MKWLLLLVLLMPGPALAEAPETSLLPQPRPVVTVAGKGLPKGPLTSLIPKPRPRSIEVIAAAAVPAPEPEAVPKARRRKGLCGDPRLVGEALESFGSSEGCGISDPVRLREVDGVKLTTSAMVDCGTATALADWIEDVAKPAFRRTGGGLARIEVFASYACRPRNNQSGARLSEHGKGHAIDIGGFILAKGTVISVLTDWGKGTAGRILKDIRRGACGIFNTVLGPGSDSFHRNHFHFDTARYRSGAYCH